MFADTNLHFCQKNITDYARSFMNDAIDTLIRQGLIQATAPAHELFSTR
ncbi:MAG: hypothetical protein HC778_03760 [Chamaesiphon sp. CSU_1_12]|nr:hypothetical protein [Chamaesiphon sp. CSU_1_12]